LVRRADATMDRLVVSFDVPATRPDRALQAGGGQHLRVRAVPLDQPHAVGPGPLLGCRVGLDDGHLHLRPVQVRDQGPPKRP
jgi:hypothetical protein